MSMHDPFYEPWWDGVFSNSVRNDSAPVQGDRPMDEQPVDHLMDEQRAAPAIHAYQRGSDASSLGFSSGVAHARSANLRRQGYRDQSPWTSGSSIESFRLDSPHSAQNSSVQPGLAGSPSMSIITTTSQDPFLNARLRSLGLGNLDNSPSKHDTVGKGHNQEFQKGHRQVFNAGHTAGFHKGQEEGYVHGYNKGYTRGCTDGGLLKEVYDTYPQQPQIAQHQLMEGSMDETGNENVGPEQPPHILPATVQHQTPWGTVPLTSWNRPTEPKVVEVHEGFSYTPPEDFHEVEDADKIMAYQTSSWTDKHRAIMRWWANDYDTKFLDMCPGKAINPKHREDSVAFYVERALPVFKNERMIRLEYTQMAKVQAEAERKAGADKDAQAGADGKMTEQEEKEDVKGKKKRKMYVLAAKRVVN